MTEGHKTADGKDPVLRVDHQQQAAAAEDVPAHLQAVTQAAPALHDVHGTFESLGASLYGSANRW